MLEVPETRRAEGTRRLAEIDAGQSRVGAFGLAALCVGQHAVSDRGSFQPSPATEGSFDNNHAERIIRPAVIIRPVFIFQRAATQTAANEAPTAQPS